MADRTGMGALTKDMAPSASVLPPRQLINQTTESQVIEKAAQLLKQVEHHWKKSLFQNRLQFSPIESLNSSESENYIEKLAAIKFKDASFRNKQDISQSGVFMGGSHHLRSQRESNFGQNLLTNYDVVNNYFDGTRNASSKNNQTSQRRRTEDEIPTMCQRCLNKSKAQENQKKSVSVLSKQHYEPKQSNYGHRQRIAKQSRGGFNTQFSPRSTESLPTNRTYTSTHSTPRIKFNSEKPRISTSNPDLRNIAIRERSLYQSPLRNCNYCGTERLNSAKSKDGAEANGGDCETIVPNNVSVINVKSNVQNGSSIPEVNPRKTVTAPDKMIIIQHLPQVDIRPELSKQVGPVISIEAESELDVQKESKSCNMGVFNYIHTNKSKNSAENSKTFSSYTGYKGLVQNGKCSEEESFAAQLELRSVAENFIFRLKKDGNQNSYILLSTLLQLMDEVNELIDLHMAGNGTPVTDPNLPPRMEMVSDLLSDELKTWGSQYPSHYQSLNNILQHLILDIHFTKSGSMQDINDLNMPTTSQNINATSSKKMSILKTKKNSSNYEHPSRQRHISLSGESNYDKERSELTYRSTHSEEMSLTDKLLQENALKVQRLEKAYKINHRARILKSKEEAKELQLAEAKRKAKEGSRSNSVGSELIKEACKNLDNSQESQKNMETSNGSSDSHPVVAIVSPSQNDSDDEENNVVSRRSAEDVEKSVVEDLQEGTDTESIPEEEDEPPSKLEAKSPDNVDEKPESDIDDEIPDETSEHSEPVDDKKESDKSDYDEDFEEDVTENPSKSATVSTVDEKKKSRHQIPTRCPGVDEICQTDVPIDLDSYQIKSEERRASVESKDDFNIIAPDKLVSSNIERLFYDSPRFVSDADYLRKNNGLSDRPTHLWQRSKEKVNIKNVHKHITENDQNRCVQIRENENFVKVHVRDEQGEMILSYAESKPLDKNPSSGKEVAPAHVTPINKSQQCETYYPSKSISNYFETEKNVLENLTSNVLKELLDDKVQEIIMKYTGKGLINKIDKNDLPSTSGVCSNEDKNTQTSLDEIKTDKLVETLSKIDQDLKNNEDYSLKSPSVKLNVKNVLIKEGTGSNGKPETDENINRIETLADSDRCSPDVKQLISLVQELDSSDVEYCEASLKQLSDDGRKEGAQARSNISVHHFNSDEFIVYPKLDPQPQDFRILHYSKEDIGRETSDGRKTVEMEQSRNDTEVIVRNVEAEFDVHLMERFHLMRNTLYSNCSTQTELSSKIKRPVSLSTNLVDFFEFSSSQSSSSCSISKRGTIKRKSTNTIPTQTESFQSEPTQDVKLNLIDIVTSKAEPSVPSSPPNIEINSSNLFVQHSNKTDTDENNVVFSEGNDEISSSSSDSDHSLTAGPRGERMLRVLEASVPRPDAWSSTSDSSTDDDDRIFHFNKPDSDSDDVLGDLDQLMDYLKHSNTSPPRVRIRQCPRHRKS